MFAQLGHDLCTSYGINISAYNVSTFGYKTTGNRLAKACGYARYHRDFVFKFCHAFIP